MPNAMSSEKEPVEMQGIATWVQASPRRMMAPSPNCFWICANTLSRSTLVFLVSLTSSGLEGCLGAMGFSLLFTCVGGYDVFLFLLCRPSSAVRHLSFPIQPSKPEEV